MFAVSRNVAPVVHGDHVELRGRAALRTRGGAGHRRLRQRLQFQNKLRNELRAKSGIMRGREFVMKDTYSVHASKEDLDKYYNAAIEAYKRCYDRFGIGDETYVTFASGGAFTKFSHEFQTICDAGEDYIYLHRGKNIAVNEKVLDEAIKGVRGTGAPRRYGTFNVDVIIVVATRPGN